MTSLEVGRKLLEETEDTLAASRQSLENLQTCLVKTSAAIQSSERLLRTQPERNRRKSSRRATDAQ